MSDAVRVPRELLDKAAFALATTVLGPQLRAALAASTPVGGWEDISTAPKEDAVGCAEREVGRAVYERIETLIGGNSAELDYLADLVSSVEEYGSYSGPTAPLIAAPPPPPPSVSTDKGSRPQEAVSGEQAEPAVVGSDGWIESADGWHASPVPDGTTISLRLSNGTETPPNIVKHQVWPIWRYSSGKPAVIAYRATPQPADGCSSNEGAGGWIEHDGGPNPAPGKRVDVKFEDGEVELNMSSEFWQNETDWWQHQSLNPSQHIIAYRILPQTEKGS